MVQIKKCLFSDVVFNLNFVVQMSADIVKLTICPMTHIYVSVKRKYPNKSRGDFSFIICGRLGRVIASLV